jgi:3-phenylpropionate/trans-cinnamate dioxygenase ferredoxin subunit
MFNFTRLDPAKCEFISIGPASDLPNGERLFVEIDGRPIVVFNLGEQLYAIGDVCSHDDGPLGDGKLEDGKVICPRHGARFDLHTGKALSLPAVVDIPAYPVRIVRGEIEIGIPVG